MGVSALILLPLLAREGAFVHQHHARPISEPEALQALAAFKS